MKKKNNNLLIALLFILGILILLYPTISNAWNERRNRSLLIHNNQEIAKIDNSKLDEIKRKAIAYNEGLIGNVVPDAFAYEEANHPNEDYELQLNPIGDDYMCDIEIPVIKVNLPVYHYTTEEVLLKGVGHLPGSSLPVGGKSTHTVLSAHRGLPSAKLFTDLDRIKEKDLFYIHVLNETLAYEVDLIKVIEPTETKDLAIVEGEDYATLFTCTPYAVNSHRLLVRGHRVDFNEDQYIVEQNKTTDINSNILIVRIICVLIGIQLALLFVYIKKQLERRRNKKQEKYR